MVAQKKYLWQHTSGRWYVRKGGRYYRIHAEDGTPEFDEEYWEILRGKRHEVRRSWSVLIAEFRQSEKWAGYKPRYREDLEKIFLYLDEKIGKRDVKWLTTAEVYKAMERNSHRVRFANYIPVALTLLVKLARRKGWMQENPAENIELLKVPEERKKPHIPWTHAGVAKWRQEAKPLALLIFEIGIGSVQRPGDWNGFSWGDYDGESLKLTQNKTGTRLLLPCTPELKEQLDLARKELGNAHIPDRPILANDDGSPMTYHKIARVMRGERERLGLLEHDLHALRYRGVKELAYAGCNDDEIASYSGHMSKAMIRHYAGEARQEMNAKRANAKRMKK
ncbi:tyrosine-type recombinase/integrase [Phaeobacter inhibens]|uniref:tyrosine-type recombinase/integrase n=1 Tax=Phaeobacter inhibens TaxID=221822 RepID=UPI0021A29DEF|nr:tyrosine-type recombinase/integrase [Phaeobacter inhibens]UWR59442.1 tyrosine-type recombinase/integrase [Phaeobacter inhibens]